MSLRRLLIHTKATSYRMKVGSSINYDPNMLNYIPRNPSNYSVIILLMGSHDPLRADTSAQSHDLLPAQLRLLDMSEMFSAH